MAGLIVIKCKAFLKAEQANSFQTSALNRPRRSGPWKKKFFERVLFLRRQQALSIPGAARISCFSTPNFRRQKKPHRKGEAFTCATGRATSAGQSGGGPAGRGNKQAGRSKAGVRSRVPAPLLPEGPGRTPLAAGAGSGFGGRNRPAAARNSRALPAP